MLNFVFHWTMQSIVLIMIMCLFFCCGPLCFPSGWQICGRLTLATAITGWMGLCAPSLSTSVRYPSGFKLSYHILIFTRIALNEDLITYRKLLDLYRNVQSVCFCVCAGVTAPSFCLCCVKIESWCPVLPGRVIPSAVVENPEVTAKTKECKFARYLCVCVVCTVNCINDPKRLIENDFNEQIILLLISIGSGKRHYWHKWE